MEVTRMTELIKRSDSRFFEQTCYKPYDRHDYKIVCESKTTVVESWEEVQEHWWNNSHKFEQPVIEVLNKPKKKSKGFI